MYALILAAQTLRHYARERWARKRLAERFLRRLGVSRRRAERIARRIP